MAKINIDKDNIFMISILPILILCSMHKVLTIIGIIGCIAYFSYVNISVGKYNTNVIPKMAIIFLLMQNVGIGLGANIAGNTSGSLSLVSQIPSLFVVISAFFVLLRRKINKLDLVFGIYAVIVVLYAFVEPGMWGAKGVYVRNFLIFYLAFIIGAYYLKDKDLKEDFIAFVLKLAVAAGIFGIVGIIFGKPFYDIMGVDEVYIARKSDVFINGLPGNFFTLFGGKWVSRLASFYFEPVNFSYFMAFSVILAATERKWKVFAFLLICEVLTFGKGGWLVMFASAGCIIAHIIIEKIFKNWDIRKVKNLVIGGITGGIIVVGTVFYLFLTDIFGGYLHFYGIITGIKEILKWPLGYGLGTAGNLVRNFSDSRAFEISETGMVSMGYQIGIIGMIMFVAILVMISIRASQNCESKIKEAGKKDFLSILSIYLPIILAIVFVFQENTFGPQCIVPYMIMQGAFNNESDNDNKEQANGVVSRLLAKINELKPFLKEEKHGE